MAITETSLAKRPSENTPKPHRGKNRSVNARSRPVCFMSSRPYRQDEIPHGFQLLAIPARCPDCGGLSWYRPCIICEVRKLGYIADDENSEKQPT